MENKEQDLKKELRNKFMKKLDRLIKKAELEGNALCIYIDGRSSVSGVSYTSDFLDWINSFERAIEQQASKNSISFEDEIKFLESIPIAKIKGNTQVYRVNSLIAQRINELKQNHCQGNKTRKYLRDERASTTDCEIKSPDISIQTKEKSK